MAEYITESDLEKRLTAAGYDYVANRDGVGSSPTDDEIADHVTPAIQWAGGMVDGAIVEFVETTHARGAGNQWLKDRCLDLATLRALQVGGRDVPESIEKEATRAMLMLYGGTGDDGIEYRGAQQMQRVPGLHIPRPDTGKTVRTPRVRHLR